MITREEIAEKVRRGLGRHQPRTVEIEVLDGEIYRDNGWWHVPVRPRRGSPMTFEYYAILAEVEEEIEGDEEIRLLLVPASPEE